uniref:Uncharacterized protein n=1 Tax=Crocodylus porosus TaxID=8502 RepID=A0A7M4EJZ0_CROPO
TAFNFMPILVTICLSFWFQMSRCTLEIPHLEKCLEASPRHVSISWERWDSLFTGECPRAYLEYVSTSGKPQPSSPTEKRPRKSPRYVSVSREHVAHCPAGSGPCCHL